MESGVKRIVMSSGISANGESPNYTYVTGGATVDGNWRPQLVKEISHITFTKMTHLELNDNRIESVEVLANIDMPHIQVIQLGTCLIIRDQNQIRAIRNLRKGRWPSLTYMGFDDNYIWDWKNLVEGCFSQLRCLWVSSCFSEKNAFIDQGFSFKLQSKAVKRLVINSKEFCLVRSIEPTLKKKWHDIKIENSE